ncbi:MAG: hypothetical protein NC320_00970 [Clostridium sp.]|nr:hypothetical protein [Clostridium sp.]
MKYKILLFLVLLGMLTACDSDKNYTYEDVEITGTVTKQYIEDEVTGLHSHTSHYYYTIVDYGGDDLKVIEDKKYYQRHNIGDEVKLVKHRTYKDGKWIKTEIKWEENNDRD